MKSFSICCFHFRITPKMHSPFSPREYVHEIETVLKKITNINKINVQLVEIGYPDKQTIYHIEGLPTLSNGDRWFPFSIVREISFEVYLPYRIQDELLNIPGRPPLTGGVERFKVQIKYYQYAPVTFIIPIDPIKEDENYESWSPVVIIRRYLEREIANQKGKLELESTAPSPLHKDLFLKLESKADKLTSNSFFKAQEDDIILFIGSTERYKDEESALNFLLETISKEVSFLYHINKSKELSYYKWHNIDSSLKDIKITNRKTKFIYKIFQFITKGYKLDILMENIFNFRAFLISEKQKLEILYRKIFSYEDTRLLKETIDEEIKNYPEFPINEVSDLVQFREQRHSKFWQIITLIMSAALGACLGSILTTLFTTQ